MKGGYQDLNTFRSKGNGIKLGKRGGESRAYGMEKSKTKGTAEEGGKVPIPGFPGGTRGKQADKKLLKEGRSVTDTIVHLLLS